METLQYDELILIMNSLAISDCYEEIEDFVLMILGFYLQWTMEMVAASSNDQTFRLFFTNSSL